MVYKHLGLDDFDCIAYIDEKLIVNKFKFIEYTNNNLAELFINYVMVTLRSRL